MSILIPMHDLESRPGPAIFSSLDEAAQTIEGMWRDGSDTLFGNRFTIEVPRPAIYETIGENGEYEFVSVMPPAQVAEQVPALARRLSLFRNGEEFSVVAVERLSRSKPIPVPVVMPIGRRTDEPDFYLVADRYDDEESFFADAKAMVAEWNSDFGPFNHDSGRFQLGGLALFWPSDTISGNFNTVDPPPPPADANPRDGKYRIIQGDQKTLVEFLSSAGVVLKEETLVLVVINSLKRFGAGGLASAHLRGWVPAWVTNHAAEGWSKVALHELGHCFGLTDEYEDPYDLKTRAYEPNVSEFSDWEKVPDPWRRMVTGHEDPDYERIVPGDDRQVSVIRGARYSQDYFRSTKTCMMRTPSHQFCPVCAEVIAGAISRRN